MRLRLLIGILTTAMLLGACGGDDDDDTTDAANTSVARARHASRPPKPR